MTESSDSDTGRPSSGTDDFNAKIVEEYRANGGKLGGMFAGSDLLWLHHTGAKSGTERISPLACQMAGECSAVPRFAEYERKAAPRKIPVIVLDPVK